MLARQEVASCEAQLARPSTDVENLRKETQELENQRSEASQSIDRIEQEIAQKGGAEAAKFKQQLDERRMAFARLEESVSNADAELKGLAERAETLTEQVKASDQEAKQLAGKEKTLSGNHTHFGATRFPTQSVHAVKSQCFLRNVDCFISMTFLYALYLVQLVLPSDSVDSVEREHTAVVLR